MKSAVAGKNGVPARPNNCPLPWQRPFPPQQPSPFCHPECWMGLRPNYEDENGFCSATSLPGSAALSFVISTGAQRSGETSVWMPLLGNVFRRSEAEGSAVLLPKQMFLVASSRPAAHPFPFNNPLLCVIPSEAEGSAVLLLRPGD